MRKKRKNNHSIKYDRTVVLAPFNERLAPEKRTEKAIELSELITKIATHIICYTIVYHQDLLKDERLSIAHAFLQRMTTTHMCNHKLTAEGLVYQFEGESFELHEEYKTMTLTRTVYEHLAMFYFLYELPKTDEQRNIVWKYWQINGKKNLLDNMDGLSTPSEEQQTIIEDIEKLRSDIMNTSIDNQCKQKLDEWTKVSNRPYNGSIEFVENEDKNDVRRIPYSQAWKYLFNNKEMALLYRHLSMHCHPAYHGLIQYQSQSLSDQGSDGIPLYLSTSLLAYLCRLFLKQIPNGRDIIKKAFDDYERFIFDSLAQK